MSADPNAIKPSQRHFALIAGTAVAIRDSEDTLAGQSVKLHDSRMEDRMRTVETAIAGIKPTLDNIGSMLGRLDATLTRLDQRMLAVETGQAALRGEFTGVVSRLGNVETAVGGTIKDAISRVPSWWQMAAAVFTTIVSGGAALGLLIAGAAWLRQHGWVAF